MICVGHIAMRRWFVISLVAGLPALASGCTNPLQHRWQAYRDAKKRGDATTAAMYLADDARIWFDKKEGPGHPLRAEGGPYKDWDKEFRSSSTRENLRVRGRTLTYVSLETNDFFRLIERTPTKARVTYYFDDDDKISGMLYQGLSPQAKRTPDRRAEFELWAAEHYPGELESEAMKIPRNPKRWRALLTEWRNDVGLPAIE